MWFKEIGDLFDVLPYYLLVCLPVFIAVCPINPVEAAQELDVHRLAQFDMAGTSTQKKWHWAREIGPLPLNGVGGPGPVGPGPEAPLELWACGPWSRGLRGPANFGKVIRQYS